MSLTDVCLILGLITGPVGTEVPELSEDGSCRESGQPVHHRPAVLHLHSGRRRGHEEQTHHPPAPEVQHRGYSCEKIRSVILVFSIYSHKLM